MGLTALRVGLGLALVAHGLGNTVLPLRGVDATGTGDWSIAATVLYVLAIVWFLKAGLGLLGVRPLSGDLPLTAAAAGVSSLGAQLLLTAPDLWPGVVLSLLLPILTVLFIAVAGGAGAPVRHPRWRLAGDIAGSAFFIWVALGATLWPYTRTWGAAPHEWVMTLPGDAPDRTPAHEILHGVTIDAPPSAVWPWLMQLGQDRAGFYSYERLERLVGADIHNVAELRPEWQTRAVGDRVHATQAGYLGGVFGERPGWRIAHLEENRAMVLEHWGAFVLTPDLRGRTRFLIRSTISNERIPVWAAALNFTAFELPHFIMQRRMMLNIKALAERG